jgi:Glycosyltransferases, probably involved in cell wall biogenesis
MPIENTHNNNSDRLENIDARTTGGVHRPAVATGKKCHCPKCQISVFVSGTQPPVACPYCRSVFAVSETKMPVADEYPRQSTKEVQSRLKTLYSKQSTWLLGAIALLGVFLLGYAVFLQLRSVDDFHYHPLVSLFSLCAGLFVVSRFVIAAFYAAPKDTAFLPTVSVLVPCMNEGESIRKTLERIFDSGYPVEQLEVVAVNDGSTDNTLVEMLKVQTRNPKLVIVDFERNRGLSHGWGVAIHIARGEFFICIDSDTFIFPGAIRKLVQGFRDPRVGGISGHCDVDNANTNILTQMQDVRYFFSYKIMKAAESVFGTVSCLPGCFSAYRRLCVLEVMDEWINATVWGMHGNYADDRSLTNLILRDYKILYDDQALATTIAPDKWKVYVRQQSRWMRSYLREIWKTGLFIWRKGPVPALSWYTMMWLPLVEPFVMLDAMVLGPLRSAGGSDVTLLSYIFGVFSITLIWALHFLGSTGRKWWWTGGVFTITYMVFFSWQLYWALATLRGKKWGTRGS